MQYKELREWHARRFGQENSLFCNNIIYRGIICGTLENQKRDVWVPYWHDLYAANVSLNLLVRKRTQFG